VASGGGFFNRLRVHSGQRDVRDLPFGEFDDGDGRYGDAVDRTGVQDDRPIATHPQSRLVRVTVTEQVPLAGSRFAVEADLVVAMHEGDFLTAKHKMPEHSVTGHAIRLKNLAIIRFAPIAIAQDEVKGRAGPLRQNRRRTDIAAMDDPFNAEFAENLCRPARQREIAMCVTDDADVHDAINFQARDNRDAAFAKKINDPTGAGQSRINLTFTTFSKTKQPRSTAKRSEQKAESSE